MTTRPDDCSDGSCVHVDIQPEPGGVTVWATADPQRTVWFNHVEWDAHVASARAEGYDAAVEALGDGDQIRTWLAFQLEALGFPTKDEYPFMRAAVDYLAAVKAEMLGGAT